MRPSCLMQESLSSHGHALASRGGAGRDCSSDTCQVPNTRKPFHTLRQTSPLCHSHQNISRSSSISKASNRVKQLSCFLLSHVPTMFFIQRSIACIHFESIFLLATWLSKRSHTKSRLFEKCTCFLFYRISSAKGA